LSLHCLVGKSNGMSEGYGVGPISVDDFSLRNMTVRKM
jgi:hypothetical protein